jgi:hypothetical protein
MTWTPVDYRGGVTIQPASIVPPLNILHRPEISLGRFRFIVHEASKPPIAPPGSQEEAEHKHGRHQSLTKSGRCDEIPVAHVVAVPIRFEEAAPCD